MKTLLGTICIVISFLIMLYRIKTLVQEIRKSDGILIKVLDIVTEIFDFESGGVAYLAVLLFLLGLSFIVRFI